MPQQSGAGGGTEFSDGVKGRRTSSLDCSKRQSCQHRLAHSERQDDVTAELQAKDRD